LFDAIDVNGNGTLEHSELSTFLEAFGDRFIINKERDGY